MSSFGLLTKGKFLQGDLKTLKELNIKNNQTVRIIQNNLEEEDIQYNKMKKEENFNTIKEIFPNLE